MKKNRVWVSYPNPNFLGCECMLQSQPFYRMIFFIDQFFKKEKLNNIRPILKTSASKKLKLSPVSVLFNIVTAN